MSAVRSTDTGAGFGASHQTGWTGLVANLNVRRYAAGGGDRVIE